MTLDDEFQQVIGELAMIDDAAAQRVESLRQALLPGAPVNGWDSVDVYQAINPQTISSSVKNRIISSARLARMEQLRNLLALLPVLLTWLALMFAVDAYKKAIDANEALVSRPFLLLWEEGFRGHGYSVTRFLTLGHVAALDAILILLLVLLTWGIHTQTNIRLSQSEREASRLESRLNQCIWQASLALGQRGSQSARFDQIRLLSEKLLDEMRCDRERLEHITESAVRQLDNLSELASDFRDGTKAFLAGSGNLHQGISDVAQAVALSRDALSDAQEQNANIDASLVSLHSSLELQNTREAEAASALEQSSLLLKDAGDIYYKAAIELLSNNAELRELIRLLQVEFTQLRDQFTKERSAYETSASGVVLAASSLENAMNSLTAASNALVTQASTMQALIDANADLQQKMNSVSDAIPTTEALATAVQEVLRSPDLFSTPPVLTGRKNGDGILRRLFGS